MENILEIIRQNLKVKDKEKKLYGEVFTPVELIYEMLDKLPEDVWSNPNLKWLDPANGIGNFPVVAYYKLMKGLESVILIKQERSKHIIEKMLYMVELNPVNCKECEKIFKMIDKDTKPNVINANFLEWSATTPSKYNIIMGNPPYNNEKSRCNPVYQKFCLSALDILNMNGYLVYIHPPGWKRFWTTTKKSKTGIVFYKYKTYYFKHISLNLSIPNFPNVDYYILQKKINNSLITNITCNFNNKIYNSKITLSNNLDFLPNLVTENTLNIINKLCAKGNKKFNIIRERKVSIIRGKDLRSASKPTVPDSINKYPHYHYTNKKGENKIYYVSEEQKIDVFNEPKIIMSFKYSPYKLNAWYDNGNFGTTDFSMHQITTNKNLVKFFNSKIIEFLLKITQYASPPFTANEYRILNLISIPEHLPDNPTDEDIYKYYDLTPEEIYLIEDIAD